MTGAKVEGGGWRLRERDQELGELRELVAMAGSGAGRCVVVVGPPGIGKTALLAAVGGEATRSGFRVCAAVAGEVERDLAWGVVRQLFAGEIRAWAGGDREVFEAAAGLALPVLGVGQAAPGADALSPALHGLYWLTANVSERAPVLITVDDVQWADVASVRFLSYLAARLADVPVVLAVAIRTGEPRAQEREALFRAAGSVVMLEPAALSAEATDQVLTTVLGRGVEPEFSRACHAATGGNPFLLSELGAQLAIDGIAPVAASASLVGEVSPRSVSRWVSLRLSRLPAEARGLVQAVAVLGASAHLTVAATLAGLETAGAGSLADLLCAAGLLEAHVPLAFVHPLVRAAVYAEIAPFARADAHARAARLIADRGGELGAVAAQIMPATPAGDAWEVDTLVAAAARAREQGAPEAAVAWLRRALAEPPPPARMVDVLRDLGAVEAELSDPAALDHARAAHTLATDPNERGRAALTLARMLVIANNPAEATAVALTALAELGGRARELDLYLEALVIDGGFHDSAVSTASSRVRGRSPDELAGNTPGERMLLGAIAARGVFSGDTPVASSVALLRRALLDDQLVVEPDDLRFWQSMYLLHVTDELDLAAELEQRAAQIAGERGSIFGLCVAATYRAHIYLLQGRVKDAEFDIDRADSFGDHVWPQGLPVRIHLALEVSIEQARIADGEVQAARLDAIDLPRTLLTPLYAVCSRGRLRTAQGRHEEAIDDLFEVGRYSPATNPAMFAWRSHAAPALAALGREEEARRLLAEELEVARSFGVARSIGVNLRARGVLEGGEAGVEYLRESVSVLEACPSVLEQARSRVELGSLLRRGGHRADAVPWLAEGLQLADRSGALGLAERARRELTDAGERPHRPAHVGRDVLTPSELRVARLAAEGASNKQIAQALFVSLRTVETHLTHSYAKLGITARPDLAAALSASSQSRGPDPMPAAF